MGRDLLLLPSQNAKNFQALNVRRKNITASVTGPCYNCTINSTERRNADDDQSAWRPVPRYHRLYRFL